MTKKRVLLAIVWLLSAASVLVRVYSLRFNPPESPVLFWLPYTFLILISAFVVSTGKGGGGELLTILAMSLVLHLLNSVRQPESFILALDPASNFQVAARLVETGHLPIGYDGFTSVAFAASFYPGLEILLCTLNLTSGVSLLELYKWAMAGINVTTIVFFYLLLKRICTNYKTVNLALFLYALCPTFHGFDSYAVHESLGIVFYPILISIFLTDQSKLFHSRSFQATFLVFALSLAITHHFSMYILVFEAVMILSGLRILGRKVSSARVELLLLLTTLLTSWQVYNAFYISVMHSQFSISALSLVFLGETQSVSFTAPYHMPLLEQIFVYGGFGLLLLTSLVGVFPIIGAKTRGPAHTVDSSLVLWWSISVAIFAASAIFPWSRIAEAPIRFRSVEFVYFGVVLFSAMGIQKISDPNGKAYWLRDRAKMRYLTRASFLAILLIIAVPTVLIGFPYHVFDNPPPRISDHLWPIESHISLLWLSTYGTSSSVVGTLGTRQDILGPASIKWKYRLFVESIRTRNVFNGPYWIHTANFLYPDTNNSRLESNDVSWLNSNLNKIYDNAAVTVLSPRNFNP